MWSPAAAHAASRFARRLSTAAASCWQPGMVPAAFVLDIDGVLVRGKRVLPQAIEAMRLLCPSGTWRHPVCFLTNGGGVTEETKAQQLADWLQVPVHADQVLLSHTPMRCLAAGSLAERPVLVVGRHDVLNVAASYGFTKVLSTSQLAAALPGALPFQQEPPPQPAPGECCPVRDLGWATESAPIAAVLVMADPRGEHWYQDLQLLTDVITSHGVPARQAPLPGSQPVQVFFSNPDMLWASSYARPRFGQGAFSTALDAIIREVSGRPLQAAKWFGKPNAEPYRLAEQLLEQQAMQLGLLDPAAVASSNSRSDANGTSTSSSPGRFSAIYAVGDNAAADVRGANRAGAPWVSVLVRTGVFQGDGPSDPHDPAHLTVTDVLAAVQAALHRARSVRWHSMR